MKLSWKSLTRFSWKFFRKTSSTIAQILIVCILLPVFAGLLGFLAKKFDFAASIADFFINLASNVNLFGGLEDAIALLLTNVSSTENQLLFFAGLVNLSYLDMFVAASAGMWAGICFKLCSLLNFKGLPLIQTILGMVISCFATWYSGFLFDELGMLLFCLFSTILNIVLSILTMNISANLIVITLTIGCEVIIGIFSTAFAALLLLMLHAPAGIAVGTWIIIHLCLLIPLIVFLVIDCMLHKQGF